MNKVISDYSSFMYCFDEINNWNLINEQPVWFILSIVAEIICASSIIVNSDLSLMTVVKQLSI